MKNEINKPKKELFLVDRKDGNMGQHYRTVVDSYGYLQPVSNELKSYIGSKQIEVTGIVEEIRLPFEDYLEQIDLAKASK